ncbi:PRTRC system protein F (plasmid) [Cupriavidus basilensis]
MLLSPRRVGESLNEGFAAVAQFQRPAAAAGRPAHDFLTLPDVSADVTIRGKLRYQTPEGVATLVRAQFDAGPLRARDVNAPTSAGDAYAQALYKWLGRQHLPFRFLNLKFSLLDADSVLSEISHQYEANSFTADASLYLAVSSDGEGIYEVCAHAEKLSRAHPQLMATALRLIEEASWRSAWIRTPSELLSHFAHFHWEGDETVADSETMECLIDRYGDDQETLQNYLPSVAREQLVPPALRLAQSGRRRRMGRRDYGLDPATLESLTRRQGVTRLCHELIHLRDLIRRARGRPLFNYSYRANPVYSAAALVWENDNRIQQLFDDLYDYDWNGGEATMHLGFIPIAQDAPAIRRQYADWQLAFQTMASIDRVIGHITNGTELEQS